MKRVLLAAITLFVFSGSYAQTFSGTGGLVPDDGTTIEFPITVSGLTPSTIDTSTFGLETVCITMTHTYDSDIDMRLVAPDGTVVLLASGVGGSDDDFMNTCFNMGASTPIGMGTAPFTGTFKPQGQLGYLNNGQNGNGTWKLRIVDMYGADQGNLLSWNITFGNTPATYYSFSSSNLPIVVINTNNQAIVDDPKIMVDFGIIYNGPGIRNYMTDPMNHYNGKAGMEVRGSSSQMFPKKTYGVELWDVNGNSIDSSLLGMPKESDWILSANYSDKSLLNNVLAYKVFTDMGHYATRTQFVEVVLNGQYNGVYILMEKIKRDKNRVDISKLKPTDIYGDSLTGGYIFKIDKTTGSGGQGWTSAVAPPNATNGEQINFLFEYPDQAAIVPQQAQYIESYVDSFETALSGPNFANLQTGYSKYIDVTSFIDMFLLNELSRNVDGYRISTYLYKDKQSKGGKLVIGPPWDYDIAWGNANYCRANDTTGWAYNLNYDCASYWMVPFWWERLLQDPVFANHLRCRWETLKTTDLGINTLHQYIDSMALYLNEGQQRNFVQWPILGSYVWPNPNPIPTTYAGEIAELKNWISARWQWMDANMPGTLAGCDLGSNEIAKETFDATVFPNPFSNQVTVRVELPSSKPVRIEVRDLSGRLLATQQHTVSGRQDIVVPLSGLAAGVYLLELRAGEQRITRKIICTN
jgi:subtilisin-like proprotein convertase family protein